MYPRPLPWSIKGKAGLPIMTSHWNLAHFANGNQHTHSNIHTHTPETWDPVPLSPVCNPYCKHSVLVTQAAAATRHRDIQPEPVYIFVSS
jgi:hypothetical protein